MHVTHRRPVARWEGDDRSAGSGQRRQRRPARADGFTFLEIILALAVVLVIASVFVFSYTSLRAGHSLREGSARFESVLRMARAEATHSGKRVRLLVDAPDGGFRVEWEPRPLTEPGAFVDFVDAGWAETLPLDLVRVVRVELGADDWAPTEGEGSIPDAARVQGVTFEADGSSPSVRFILAAVGDDEHDQAVVEIDGVNGLITTHEAESEPEPESP